MPNINNPPAPAAKPDLNTVAREEYAHVYRYCYSLCGNPDEAADAVQQAFLSLTKYQNSIKQWEKIRSWLFTTAKRQLFAQSENRKRQAEVNIDEAFMDESQFAVNDQVMEQLDGQTAVAALQELDSLHREALVLFYLEQFTYEQISEHLAVPLGTVMSRLYRGKRKLAAVFNAPKS